MSSRRLQVFQFTPKLMVRFCMRTFSDSAKEFWGNHDVKRNQEHMDEASEYHDAKQRRDER